MPTSRRAPAERQFRRYLEASLGCLQRHVLADTLGFAAVLVFVLHISWPMRQAEAPERLCSHLAVPGGLVAVWYWLQGSLDAVPLVLADDAGKLTSYSDQALVALELLLKLGETSGDVATVPRALLVLAVSLLALRTRFLPRWTALSVVALSLLGLLGSRAVPAWAVHS